MPTPHKHKDLIIAWASGAEIQILSKDGEWKDWPDPHWGEDFEYRIKPEEKKPVVRWLWAWVDNDGNCHYSTQFFEHIEGAIKLEWSRTEFPE